MDLDGPAALFDMALRTVERITLHVRLAFAKREVVALLGRRYALAYDDNDESYAIVPSLRALHVRGVVLTIREADALLVTLSRHRSEWGRDGYPNGFSERLGAFCGLRHDAQADVYHIYGERFAGGADELILLRREADELIVALGIHRRDIATDDDGEALEPDGR